MLMVINENIVFTARLINELAVNKHNDRVIVMLGHSTVEIAQKKAQPQTNSYSLSIYTIG